MRPVALAVTLSLVMSLSADAQTPMSADAFDAYVQGRTLYYTSRGVPYGAEQYLSDRRVIWTFLDGTCQEGHWYESDGLICFVYDTAPDPQCWSFWEQDGALSARFEDDPAGTELYEVRQSDQPLNCPGPEIGV
jgi:hypothetical protein